MLTRIQSAKEIWKKKFDALLISSIPNIIYLTGFNGFSKDERECYLLLTKRKNYIFTDARYLEAVSKIANFELAELSSNRNFEKALKEIIVKEKINNLAIDEDDLRISEVLRIKKVVKISPDENIIEKLRELKDELEIKDIKKACSLGDDVFKFILTQIKLGIIEKELAKKIEIFILENNAEVSFRPIVAFGENSSSPHHVASDRKLEKNEIVLLDFGVKAEDYCSDMTRTVFFGKVNSEHKRLYKTVLEAQTKAIELISSSINNHKSISGSQIDKVAREHILNDGYPTIPHSLGHGIGLEVHEKPSISPKSKDEIKIGMVFSVEPGIYIPGVGGIRIEDLVYIGKNGLQIITRANRELIEL
jgi:Xaa-Pro aminopeptidase